MVREHGLVENLQVNKIAQGHKGDQIEPSRLAKEATIHNADKPSVKAIVPVVKLGEEKTYRPWEAGEITAIVVKVSDILTHGRLSSKPIFDEIKRAGGIHNFLGFNGEIILSPIMEDRKVLGLSNKAYAKIINELDVDSFITLDAATYHGQVGRAAYNMHRALRGTKYLLKKCQRARALGLAKGSNVVQIDAYANQLLALGISGLVFHVGDFLSRGSKEELYEAKEFFRLLRLKTKLLMVYGLGSHRHMLDFYPADAFITQSHFTYKMDSREKIMRCLSTMKDTLKRLQRHPKLSAWMEDREKVIEWAVVNQAPEGYRPKE